MGRVRYKYVFDRAVSVGEVVERFGAITGLDIIVIPDGRSWVLTAHPFLDDIKISIDGPIAWVIPDSARWLTTSYFVAAFSHTLNDLGCRPRRSRPPRYAARRWDELPRWQQWLHR